MDKQRILSILGYEPALLQFLSKSDRDALRADGVVWLFACLLLGLCAGYAAWLVLPSIAAPLFVGPGMAWLTLNLLRILNAGGGTALQRTIAAGDAVCARYRPSLAPAAIFVVLGILLSQPAQLPFWPEIDREVEMHRQQLMAQHDSAAQALGTKVENYQQELAEAGFPIYRVKRIWQDPKRALRWTGLLCMLVLLPTIWSQFLSLRSRRAYELQRYRRNHRRIAHLQHAGRKQRAQLLAQWPSYTEKVPS